jgi:hypothetical protein
MANFIAAIAKQLQKEQAELDSAQDITKAIFPVIKDLKSRDITHPIILKSKLINLPDEYCDVTYGLCRIATDGGPEGSIIVLDPKKVLSIIDQIEVDEQYQPKGTTNKKFILGFSKKVANAIRGAMYGKLATICHLVNDLVLQKIINTPSVDRLKTVAVKISKLKQSLKDKSR